MNGFGRIGRLAYRVASQHKDIQVVAVNDLAETDHLAYLLKYDTVHGRFPGEVLSKKDHLLVEGKKVHVFNEKDPKALPWKDLGIQYVLEATGRFTHEEEAKQHIQAGAKRVIISAPAKGKVPTLVMGVNHTTYDPKKDVVVCNASCTTNCLAPLTKILWENFGIEEGLMTTIHAMTATQAVVDGPSQKDWRGGRAAAYNLIPASTGAAQAVAKCLPEIEGKLTGMAFRVPCLDVSAVDLTVKLTKKTTYEEICSAVKQAAEHTMKGIMGYTDEEVVSSDFIGSSYSSIFDQLAGIALNAQFYKLIAWYDNEMGYSHRVVDLMCYMASKE